MEFDGAATDGSVPFQSLGQHTRKIAKETEGFHPASQGGFMKYQVNLSLLARINPQVFITAQRR